MLGLKIAEVFEWEKYFDPEGNAGTNGTDDKNIGGTVETLREQGTTTPHLNIASTTPESTPVLTIPCQTTPQPTA